MERDENRDSSLVTNGILSGHSFSLRLVECVCIAVLSSRTCYSGEAISIAGYRVAGAIIRE